MKRFALVLAGGLWASSGHAAVVHFYPGQPYTPVISPLNLVQNGDFNADPLTVPGPPVHQNPTVSGFTITSVVPSDRALTLNNNSGVVGGRGLRLSGYRGLTDITQVLPTAAGQVYELSFFLAVTGPTGTHLQVSEGTTVLATLDNTPGNVTTGPNYTAFFSEYTYDFTAASDATPLTFEYQDPRYDLYLSNVAVLAVPEPASMAVLGAGLVMLATLRRRRA